MLTGREVSIYLTKTDSMNPRCALPVVIFLSLAWRGAYCQTQEKYKWALRCMQLSNGRTVQSYYEPTTDRSHREPLPLPQGGLIVSVFPDDREFTLTNDMGYKTKYENARAAIGQRVPLGKWTVFTSNPGGIAVFIR